MKVKYIFQKGGIEYNIFPTKKQKEDLEVFVSSNSVKISKLLSKQLKIHKHVKFQLSVQVVLVKYVFEEKKYIRIFPWFCSFMETIISKTSLKEKLIKAFRQMLGLYDNFLECGSGWILQKCKQIRLSIVKYVPFQGGCLKIELPKELRNKKSCLSIDSSDNMCFIYAVLAGIYSKKNKRNLQRTSQYDKFIDSLNLTNISYPVQLSQVKHFELDNDISVNVYGYEKGTIFPCYVTSFRNKTNHVNLLLYKNHYYSIRNLSALISGYYRSRRNKVHVCNFCLCIFKTKKRLETHNFYCSRDIQRYSFPKSKSFLKFEHHNKKVPVPFVIYADFEAMNQPVIDINKTKSTKKTKHIPISFCAKRVCTHDKYSSPLYLYRGQKCVENFFGYLETQKKKITDIILNKKAKMIWLKKDQIKSRKQDHCYLCQKKLKRTKYGWGYRDHNHLSGKWLGNACNKCNFVASKHDVNMKIPVICHNMQNYDMHFLIKELHKISEKKIYIIPRNTEKYLAIEFDGFIFIDSFQFLGESLEKLAFYLKEKDPSLFIHLAQRFKSKRRLDLLMQKGVFCYDYIDSLSRFKEKQLPPVGKFYNVLIEKNITEVQYEHAKCVWQTFNCSNLGDYHDIYLKTDVLLLTDVFENFRKSCMDDYSLDPAHYLSAPQLTWDALLLSSKIKLELISDPDQFNFIEKGIRGGVSQISQRYSKANNTYLSDYDSSKPSVHILYLDANALYSYAMCQYLPYKDFRWLEQKEADSLNPLLIEDDSDEGYILEVTLKYPKILHDIQAHKDLPLAPERSRIDYNELSPTAKVLCEQFKLKSTLKCEKLLTTFKDKCHYILHYQALKLYLRLGLELVKIHRVLKFKQKPWMKEYILFNIKKRREASNNFERMIYKLYNNACFGKTLENVKKHVNVKMVSNSKTFKTLTSKPTFYSFKIFHKKLVGVQMKKPVIKLAKPIYVGMSILDISKTKIFKFHYLYISEKYGDRAKLLFTDTDSLCYEIKTEDVYRDLLEDKDYFDFSNYPQSHFLYSDQNKAHVGYFKDESAGNSICEFVGLKSKMYSIEYDEEELNIKKVKGIKKSTIEKHIKHMDFILTLINSKRMEHSFHNIGSKKHQIFTLLQRKVSLSSFDDKRYLLVDKIHSVPYGHYKILRKRSSEDSNDEPAMKHSC